MIQLIRISEATLEAAHLRIAELARLYSVAPMDRVLFKGGRYVVTLQIIFK